MYKRQAIESGEGDASTIGSETIATALREAREAEDVEAVVLRVNSPGGSALASDVIWRETILLKESGKPFVVSTLLHPADTTSAVQQTAFSPTRPPSQGPLGCSE